MQNTKEWLMNINNQTFADPLKYITWYLDIAKVVLYIIIICSCIWILIGVYKSYASMLM